MSATNSQPLRSYRHDPLDRLASRTTVGQDSEQCFYQANRLTTEIHGAIQRSWLQTSGYLLAQQQRDAGTTQNVLMASDQQGSVLQGLDTANQQAFAYSVYGNRHPAQEQWYLPGFNRERPDPVTGHYLLGNGYRAFNPVLMRFNSPDNLSPFGKGGLNAYAYCRGNPVNQVDPDGHMLKKLPSLIPFRKKPVRSSIDPTSPEALIFPTPSAPPAPDFEPSAPLFSQTEVAEANVDYEISVIHQEYVSGYNQPDIVGEEYKLLRMSSAQVVAEKSRGNSHIINEAMSVVAQGSHAHWKHAKDIQATLLNNDHFTGFSTLSPIYKISYMRHREDIRASIRNSPLPDPLRYSHQRIFMVATDIRR